MTVVKSRMIPLGTKAPTFNLEDAVSGKMMTLQDLKSDRATVVMFICNHCPFVKHIRQTLVNVAREYSAKGVAFIAINSNDYKAFPDDSPEMMKKYAEEFNFPFPYLIDETQEVAKVYQAECTPDFYVFDQDLKCVYRGRFDASSPGNRIEVTGEELTSALDHILKEEPVSQDQQPSMGCNIKWKN